MLSRSLLFLLLICSVFTASAQYNFSKVDAWLDDNIKDLGGRAVLMIYKDGKIVYENNANEITRRQKLATKIIAKRKGKDAKEMLADLDRNSQERVASCSKWLSAALVMTFVDEGRLQLTDTIGKFLPVMTANGKGHIQIWHCLAHLTGIKQESITKLIGRKEKPIESFSGMDTAIGTIAIQDMAGEPGKTFQYGNAGLQIAAAIIEKISGKRFETLFAERITGPCNMPNTHFGHKAVPLAAGGAFSTPVEYMNFLVMILNNGLFNGKRVLSEQSVAAMQMNRVAKDAVIIHSPAEAGNWGYGFGEWVMDNAVPANGSSNGERSSAVTSPGLFGSFPWVDNQRQYAGMLFTLNLKSKGRGDRYKELKRLVDEAVNSQ